MNVFYKSINNGELRIKAINCKTVNFDKFGHALECKDIVGHIVDVIGIMDVYRIV